MRGVCEIPFAVRVLTFSGTTQLIKTFVLSLFVIFFQVVPSAFKGSLNPNAAAFDSLRCVL